MDRGPAHTSPAPQVRFTDLSFTYSTRLRPALRDLTFELRPGETVLVLGPSGSGKSTLTLCLDGLIPHLVEGDYEGEVVVAGLVVKDSPVAVLARQTGLVFQDPESQFCTLTVEDEIAFGLENLQTPAEEIDPAIGRSLDAVGLPGLRGRYLSSLSGGEKQRVALAAVLAMGPRLLVLDEPSANLDPVATTELFAIVRDLAADGEHTIVIIEHKLDEVIDWVDSVLVLDADGRVAFRGDPGSAFYKHADQLSDLGVWIPQTAELVSGLRAAGWEVPGTPLVVGNAVEALCETPGLAARLRGVDSLTPAAGAGGAAEPGRSAAAQTGPPFAAAVGSAPTAAGAAPTAAVADPTAQSIAPFLTVQSLSFAYPGGRSALEEVSFSLAKGAFLAIVGANGAGKTTLGSLLSGILTPPKGTVFLEGEDVDTLSQTAVAAKAAYVFQNPEHQFVADTVKGELAYSLLPRGRGRWHRLPVEQARLVDEWLERLGLLRLAEANPFSLSQGQKRRLSVAAMLIRGCPLLILDEPTLGQDARQATLLMTMMREFQTGGGTVAMITHDMRIVAERASHVLALSQGQSVYFGDPAGLFALPDVVGAARLALPAIARVAHRLEASAGIRSGLLTRAAFLEAAGQADVAGPEGAGS